MWYERFRRYSRYALVAAVAGGLLAGCGGDDDDDDDDDVIVTPETFTLQLLHLTDQEAGAPAIEDAPRLSAVLWELENDYPDNTIILSSGDAFIAGPFFAAGTDESLVPLIGEPLLDEDGEADLALSQGRADILIQNALGVQAIAFGNHEFDAGPGQIAALIPPNSDGSYPGARFPYLSANIDFGPVDALADLVVPDAQPASSIPGSIANSTVVFVDQEPIGVVGATTPNLPNIANTGTLEVNPDDPSNIPALAAIIQDEVDELIDEGVNKIILLTHMQQLSVEQQLATLLSGVDIIVGGGSNTILADNTDRLRAGDTAADTYPLSYTSAAGEPIYLVNTDGNYRYLGRLVVAFNEEGVIIPASIDPAESGAYATDAQGVADLGDPEPIAEVVELTGAISDVLVARESNQFGQTLVYLDGRRAEVRTEETNLGNLTADANLYVAQQYDPGVAISLKNGGGIRDDIGEITYPPGSDASDEFLFLPPPAIPQAGKEEGEISEFDISNTLRFNNGLAVLTVTAAGLLEIMEHAVSATEPGATPGQFPQVGGIRFSFDPALPAGDRVQSLVVLDSNGAEEGGETDVVVQDSELQGDATRTFTLVTLDFLAGWDGDSGSFDPDGNGLGGDSYPFPGLAQGEIVRLVGRQELAGGVASFADPGSEQDALAEYLAAVYPTTSPFNQPETEPAQDTRIQNLSVRNDTVIAP